VEESLSRAIAGMAAERKTKPVAKHEIATEVTENAAAFFAFEIGFDWLCFCSTLKARLFS